MTLYFVIASFNTSGFFLSTTLNVIEESCFLGIPSHIDKYFFLFAFF